MVATALAWMTASSPFASHLDQSRKPRREDVRQLAGAPWQMPAQPIKPGGRSAAGPLLSDLQVSRLQDTATSLSQAKYAGSPCRRGPGGIGAPKGGLVVKGTATQESPNG
jgi:hypothetical protein